ncbi:MAG TPA: FAD-binding oxidoreductase [Methylomirabilota bacterium]|jgi:sarcosine oxidase subunit beta|nr:FAD-binding oxidoreductase [Methylomirabilota bacterium]
MADTSDVVVIGGGVNGISIAYALAARGVKRVTLCEKAALASGASGRSSALVRMHYTNEWDARLAWASFPVFRDWPSRMGTPTVFTRTGFLTIVAPPYAENLRRNVEMLRAIGVNTVALAPDDVVRLQPFMHLEDVGAAAYEPDSGYASPADTVEGFRRRAEALGARVRQWTPVTRIVTTGDRVTGVETPAGRIDAAVVVVAAGAWSTGLCQAMGVALPARVKSIDTVLVRRPPELATPHLTVIDNVQGTYFRPESGVLTIVGVPCRDWDPDPDTMATGLPPTAAAEGAQLLSHRIPAMERATLARGFRAFDGYSRDGHAILDRVEGIGGLYLATAFSGSGFKIAPAVGTCMAELILDGEAKTVDLRAFGLRRFAEGRPLEGPYPYAPRVYEPELDRDATPAGG